MPKPEFRWKLEELLVAFGWDKVESLQGYTCWFIPGTGLRPPGSPGQAGSLLEAIRQQLEREAGAGDKHGMD
jgi:hypothetical protein